MPLHVLFFNEIENYRKYSYTGQIPQRLNTDVHSAVTAMVRIVMLQR